MTTSTLKHARRVAILTPAVRSPQKAHYAGAMRSLSAHLEGDVFTSSSQDIKDLTLSNFRLYAVRNDGTLRSKLRRLMLQTFGTIRAHRRRRYDAIIAHDPYASGLAGYVASRVTGAQLIIEMNGDYHETAPNGKSLKGRFMKFLMSWLLGRAVAIRVLNASQQQFLNTRFPGLTVFKFPEYAALAVFQDAQVYQGHHLLSVGFPFQLKGVDLLIRAFRLVASRHPDVSLRIMGYAVQAELEHFRKLAEGCPKISFVPAGWIDDVAEQVRGAVALVNAARTEALGRVHLEAMAAGKPVIASRTNGALECVEDGVTGILFDIGSWEGLADALDRLLSDREAARRMGVAGRARVEERFSEAAYGRNVAVMVSSVCGGESPS